MKIIINRVGTGPMTLEDFAEQHGLTMVVEERPKAYKDVPRYYAMFSGAEVKEGCMLAGAYGNGHTPEQAIKDYANRIAGQVLVLNAMRSSRLEIQCPNEWL